MAHRFLSKEWLAEGKRHLEASPEFKKSIHGLSARLLSVIEDPPKGGGPIFVFFEFKDGKVSKAEVGTSPALGKREAEFRVTGSYDTFAKLHQGKLSVTSAYFTRKVHLHGDHVFALRHAAAFLKYHDVMRHVETVF